MIEAIEQEMKVKVFKIFVPSRTEPLHTIKADKFSSHASEARWYFYKDNELVAGIEATPGTLIVESSIITN